MTIGSNQNVRIPIELEDFYGTLSGNNELALSSVDCMLRSESDNSESASQKISCKDNCVKGKYSGTLEFVHEKMGSFQVQIFYIYFSFVSHIFKLYCRAYITNNDKLRIGKIMIGRFLLESVILDGAEGIITDSCDGKVTGNLFFGKAGVGKSTVASLVSGTPGLFKSASSASGSTTRGTWMSRAVLQQFYMQKSNTRAANN